MASCFGSRLFETVEALSGAMRTDDDRSPIGFYGFDGVFRRTRPAVAFLHRTLCCTSEPQPHVGFERSILRHRCGIAAPMVWQEARCGVEALVYLAALLGGVVLRVSAADRDALGSDDPPPHARSVPIPMEAGVCTPADGLRIALDALADPPAFFAMAHCIFDVNTAADAVERLIDHQTRLRTKDDGTGKWVYPSRRTAAWFEVDGAGGGDVSNSGAGDDDTGYIDDYDTAEAEADTDDADDSSNVAEVKRARCSTTSRSGGGGGGSGGGGGGSGGADVFDIDDDVACLVDNHWVPLALALQHDKDVRAGTASRANDRLHAVATGAYGGRLWDASAGRLLLHDTEVQSALEDIVAHLPRTAWHHSTPTPTSAAAAVAVPAAAKAAVPLRCRKRQRQRDADL